MSLRFDAEKVGSLFYLPSFIKTQLQQYLFLGVSSHSPSEGKLFPSSFAHIFILGCTLIFCDHGTMSISRASRIVCLSSKGTVFTSFIFQFPTLRCYKPSVNVCRIVFPEIQAIHDLLLINLLKIISHYSPICTLHSD